MVFGARPSDPAAGPFAQDWHERAYETAAALLKPELVIDDLHCDGETIGNHNQSS